MANPARRPATLLFLAGVLLLLICAAGVAAGLLFAERLFALLPPVTIDAAAVGGAAVALGIATGLLGVAHLALAIGLRRGSGLVAVPSIVLCAAMAVLSLAWAVAALVSAASGSAPPAAMLAAGIGLLLVAAAYAWAGGVLIGLRGRSEAGD
jgi:hypothetical protein